jgi:predicted transcriptional regulator of viral defense system
VILNVDCSIDQSTLCSIPSSATKIVQLARRTPVTAADLKKLGLPRIQLTRLQRAGVLERVSRGVYRAAGAAPSELASVVEVAKRVPRATVCLLTALQIHNLTTEVPHEVWILIHNRARTPRVISPSIHVVRASGEAASHGIESRQIEGVAVRVTTVAKTVADCFRYRDHVGLEVALAALRDYLRRSRNVDALAAAARADRVFNVLRPYLEALV